MNVCYSFLGSFKIFYRSLLLFQALILLGTEVCILSFGSISHFSFLKINLLLFQVLLYTLLGTESFLNVFFLQVQKVFSVEVQNLKFNLFKSKVLFKRFTFEQILVLRTTKHFAFEKSVVILNKGFLHIFKRFSFRYRSLFQKRFLLGTEVFFKIQFTSF